MVDNITMCNNINYSSGYTQTPSTEKKKQWQNQVLASDRHKNVV